MTKASVQKTIVLFPWGDTWEDWFDGVGVTFEDFCKELTGGWKNNYIDALGLKGTHVVMIYASGHVDRIERHEHVPTGATIVLIPTSRLYNWLRKRMIHKSPSLGYFGSLDELFGPSRGVRRLLYKVIRHCAAYTPLSPIALMREIKLHRCEAILCQDYEQPRFDLTVLIGRLMRMPVFTSFQSGKHDFSAIGRFLRPWTMRACTGFAIGTTTEQNRILRHYRVNPQRIFTIFNPVNVPLETPTQKCIARNSLNISQDAVVVSWHGRIDIQQKGLDLLVEAWVRLCRQHTGLPLVLRLMGAGIDSADFDSMLKSTGLNNIEWRNEYVNDRNDINQFLIASDIYLFTSRYEGFPVAPIEAMAVGLPIVATEADGIPDIFADSARHGGRTVPVDDCEGVVRALSALINDRPLRNRMSVDARARAEHTFSLNVVGSQLDQMMFPEEKRM